MTSTHLESVQHLVQVETVSVRDLRPLPPPLPLSLNLLRLCHTCHVISDVIATRDVVHDVTHAACDVSGRVISVCVLHDVISLCGGSDVIVVCAGTLE